MTSPDAGKADVRDFCRAPAVAFLREGGTETLLCARYLMACDAPAGEAYARLASSPQTAG
jgi:hypothetical protein